MMIYRAALVRSEAIDLWPQDYVENPADDLSLAPRIAKARAKVQMDTYTPRFRSQHDLQYVRKTMATGLLATCRQVYREAALLFWCENTFRFSGDYEWFGIRRFLAAIGPRATSRIPKLEVFVPLDRDQDESSRRAKNAPKMQMEKVFKDDHCALVQNVDNVFHTLRELQSSLELHLILPKGSSLHENSFNGISDEFYIPEELGTGPPFLPRMTLIVESGAYMNGPDVPQHLTDLGVNVACLPGSFWKQDLNATDDGTELTELRRWVDPLASFDYLIGTPELFDETESFSIARRGGRANTTSGPRRAKRILKGFGGCKFTRRYGWDCVGCGKTEMFPGLDPRGWASKHCVFCQRITYHDVREVVEVKKMARAIRQGFTRRENVAARP
jgi:hypothetical protein